MKTPGRFTISDLRFTSENAKPVAQTSKSAVSRVSKPADGAMTGTPPIWKLAIRFMERFNDSQIPHSNHEPDADRCFPLPLGGEGLRVRGKKEVHGEFRPPRLDAHRGHEPERSSGTGFQPVNGTARGDARPTRQAGCLSYYPVHGEKENRRTCSVLPVEAHGERSATRDLSALINSKFKTQNSKLYSHHSSPVTHHSSLITRRRQGMALVVTLILMAVTLVMAIAFLAISRRERSSVTTTTDTFTAKQAADAALAQAEAQIVAGYMTSTNPYISSLIVSTNFINNLGFTTGSSNPTNVNYNNYINGTGPLSVQDFEQNVENLLYLPRPPVFYSNDFRFYLDLNRNGMYDTNGIVTNLNNAGVGLGTTSQQVGDPEWIGILEHPGAPHGPNNPFVARFCFIAVPANSLDLNYIHNQAFEAASGDTSVNPPAIKQDGYWRDQGVGTWEINLAAFLADLNTNRWDPPTSEPYSFPELAAGDSFAFDDARALIAWRYNNDYPLLATADNMFGGSDGLGDSAFRDNGIDYYGSGQQITFDTNFAFSALHEYENPALAWLGAPNTNNFFSSPADLFDTNKSSVEFVTNLVMAGALEGAKTSTYDRYTFYRMLAQLGTDTAPESGKINLNYENAAITYVTSDVNVGGATVPLPMPQSISIVPNAETNFVPWNPLDFFTAAADRMLHTYSAAWFESSPSNYIQNYYGYTDRDYLNLSGVGVTNGWQCYCNTNQNNQIPSFGITNIPVYINGSFVYSPAINRVLQLAANIYDASTNNFNAEGGNYPSVFRPIFWTTNQYKTNLDLSVTQVTNVYIRGYQYVQEGGGALSKQNTKNNGLIFTTPVEVNSLPYGLCSSNVWGVPWIVGAKKGLPNFNGFELDNRLFIQRELQFTRSNAKIDRNGTFPFGRTYATNQMYIIGISNMFTSENWNSYVENYQDQVQVVAQDYLTMNLAGTNGANTFAVATSFFTNNANNPLFYEVNGWAGRSYDMPLGSNVCVSQNLNPEVPQFTNLFVLYFSNAPVTVQGYTFTGPCFIPVTLDPSNELDGNYLDRGTPPLPAMSMNITNHLQAYMLDTKSANNEYILDYVQLGDMDSSLSVNQAIADFNGANGVGGLWSTNYYAGNTPYGVYEQYLVSSIGGNVPTVDANSGAWTTAPVPGLGTEASPAAQQAFFSAFFTANDEAPYGTGDLTNTELSIQAPYTPMRLVVQTYVLQANDPLVHYMSSDLTDYPDDTSTNVAIATAAALLPVKYVTGIQSDRYMPWGTSGNMANESYGGVTPDNNLYNLSYKDPLVLASDNWDFPTNKYPTIGWLGRVHRGTPWQSVYLKSTNILSLTEQIPNSQLLDVGQTTWELWTGDLNPDDAYNNAPVWDHLLFDLFTAAPDDDATRGQLSVNIGADDPNNPLAGLASWSAALSGVTTFSNDLNDTVVLPGGRYKMAQDAASALGQTSPSYSISTVQPMGITNFPMWQIVEGINRTRTNFVNIDGLKGVFEHVGDILSTPQLSDASPLLHVENDGNADSDQQENGISDEMYEWLPQQILSLLDVSGTPQSPPRYVIYCYGQTLKPAPDGIVASGAYFGLCTNYQVMAESAARAVITVQNAPTPSNPSAVPHVVIEQFNPLPPD